MQPKQPVSLKTYRPLLTIIALVLIAAIATNAYIFHPSPTRTMQFFMGYFFLFFGTLKVITLQKFVKSFAMYDPLAARINAWGYIYPFVELALAYAFISRWLVREASIVTIIILSITTLGIYQKVRKKEDLHCACIGMLYKLPLTKVTLVENIIMIIMAIIMIAII